MDDGKGHVCGINTMLVEWKKDDSGRWTMNDVPGKEYVVHVFVNIVLNYKWRQYTRIRF